MRSAAPSIRVADMFLNSGRAGRIEIGQRAGEYAHVGDGQVEPLGSCRRHDMRSVAGEEEAAVLHRLDDETMHLSDALLNDRTAVEFPSVGGLEARVEFLPYAFVGPVVDVLVERALQVEAGEGGGAHRVQGEAAFMK